MGRGDELSTRGGGNQGWGPLCAFLGVPVPDAPFPNLNDRAAIKKTIRQMILGTYMVLAGYMAAILVAVYLAYRLLR